VIAEAAQADQRSDTTNVGQRRLGRVLLLTASVGGGHTRAAEAIAASLARLADEGRVDCEAIDVVDVLAHTTRWFRAAYRGTYLGLLERAPSLLGWLYERSDRAYRGVRTRWATAHANARPLRRLLASYRPDLVVSTHFLPSEYLAGLRRRGRLDARLATVVTDVHVHGMWLADPCDHYFVANEESRRTLEIEGVPPTSIDATGIPIDPRFVESIEPLAARRRHGLPIDRPVVLFTTGGACVGPVASLFRSLLALETRCCVLAVCGKSEAARTALEAVARDHDPTKPAQPKVLGFTTEMHDLMAAADLLVGKPGGLTSTEARARGLPMAIVHSVPGQEEHNAAALLEAGCAIQCAQPGSAGWKIDRLLSSPERLGRMRASALATATPRAGLAVAERLADRFARRFG
jgi:processive 1,2-diacylglycerol beta-glucosyltransferase